jgi:hypothetical protein
VRQKSSDTLSILQRENKLEISVELGKSFNANDHAYPWSAAALVKPDVTTLLVSFTALTEGVRYMGALRLEGRPRICFDDLLEGRGILAHKSCN